MSFLEEYIPSNLNSSSDEELLKASLERPDLFSMLITRYQDAFFRAAYSILRQREEAEDIVQEAFTKIYLHGSKFEKQEHASFKSWAYRIVINTAISRYRKLKRIYERSAPLDMELYENLPGKENFQADIENKFLTDDLLSNLSPDLKRAVQLYYLQGLPYKEIATTENISLSTLKMRLFRAKKNLKNFLKV